MPETRSMASKSSANGADTSALTEAASAIGSEAKVLLQPDGPIDLYTSAASETLQQGNASKASAGFNLPGAEPQLQDLLHDSPFLDLDSPMTPYEWFKFVVMVSILVALSGLMLAFMLPASISLWNRQPAHTLHSASLAAHLRD